MKNLGEGHWRFVELPTGGLIWLCLLTLPSRVKYPPPLALRLPSLLTLLAVLLESDSFKHDKKKIVSKRLTYTNEANTAAGGKHLLDFFSCSGFPVWLGRRHKVKHSNPAATHFWALRTGQFSYRTFTGLL